MREVDFLDAVGRVDKQYIEECITYQPQKKRNVWFRSISAAAACVVLVIAAVFLVRHANQPVIIDENGFYIENGVLLRYTGTETDITIPETVETIADFTFLENENATKIQFVRLGKSVQTVEANAFAGLENLVDIIIAENNLSFVYEDGLVMTSDGTILLRYDREGETSFTMPASVRFVAAHAVQGTELETIDFGENLEYIGYNAFAGNDKLKAIYLPDSVKYISEGAFSGCMSAVDGYIPSGAQIGSNAFFGVPFHLTMQAGQMSPLEERMRGLVTPSEEIVKSDLAILESQIYYTLAALRGEDISPQDETARRAFSVGSHAPKIPDGMVVPTAFTLADLTYTDGTGIYDVCIHIPAGEYTIVLQAIPENLPTALYWESVIYRIHNLFYMQNPAAAESEDTVTAFGWTAVFGHEDGLYSGITYTHEDGTIIHSHIPATSTTPYKLMFSPGGTRVAIEYTNGTQPCFYIQSLNGDKLLWDFSDYNEYLNKYNGQYVAGTLEWIDEDNIKGQNEYGHFRFNIYEFKVTQLDEEVPLDEDIIPDVAPCRSAQVNALPGAVEEARITAPIFTGSPIIYVFDDDLCFYIAYLHGDMSIAAVHECTLSLPSGYTDGRIVNIERRGSDGMHVYVAAKVRGRAVMLCYLICWDGGLPWQEEVRLGSPDPSALLYMSVSELEENYGPLTLEYSEHGPGQPVYSIENLPGVLLVFYGWDMNDPLADNMLPAELILTEAYERDVFGLAIGKDVKDAADFTEWDSVEYDLINGTIHHTKTIDGLILTAVTSAQGVQLPDEAVATDDAWAAWEAEYLKAPSGEIRKIRIRTGTRE